MVKIDYSYEGLVGNDGLPCGISSTSHTAMGTYLLSRRLFTSQNICLSTTLKAKTLVQLQKPHTPPSLGQVVDKDNRDEVDGIVRKKINFHNEQSKYK